MVTPTGRSLSACRSSWRRCPRSHPRSAAPSLNDPRQPDHRSWVVRELVQFLNDRVDFLPRRKPIRKSGIRDILHGNRVDELHLALSSCWLDHGQVNILESPVEQQARQPGANIRIAAAPPDNCAVELVVSPECEGIGKSEAAAEVDILDDDEPAWAQVVEKGGYDGG